MQSVKIIYLDRATAVIRFSSLVTCLQCILFSQCYQALGFVVQA